MRSNTSAYKVKPRLLHYVPFGARTMISARPFGVRGRKISKYTKGVSHPDGPALSRELPRPQRPPGA